MEAKFPEGGMLAGIIQASIVSLESSASDPESFALIKSLIPSTATALFEPSVEIKPATPSVGLFV